jgi:hypothetical protein
MKDAEMKVSTAIPVPLAVYENRILDFQELKDEYFANINAAKPEAAEKTDNTKDAATSKQKKPMPKKKAPEDDPFASEEDEEDTKQAVKSDKSITGAKRPKESDGDDEDERPTKKKS